MNRYWVENIIEHVKRYVFLGLLAIIPVSMTFFIINYLYKNIDQQIDRLLPTISGYRVSWFEIFALFFALYLIGIVSSYLLGKRVNRVTKKIADLFPHVQEMNRELEIAQKVQETIIPVSSSTDYFEVAVDYVPCNVIGGDFIQYELKDPKKLLFIIGDVTGHGLPAALLTNRLHMEFDRQIQKGKQPGALMKGANEFVARAFKGTSMYFSAFCGLIDYGKMELIYSNCGHIPQYVYRKADDRFIELKSHATMLGLIELESGDEMQSAIKLKEDDRVILFTDGIPETVGAKQERYGVDRFQQAIRSKSHEDPIKFNSLFLSDLLKFTEEVYEDDVCLMTIGLKSKSNVFDKLKNQWSSK